MNGGATTVATSCHHQVRSLAVDLGASHPVTTLPHRAR
jgi:hypothetical protein